MTLRILPLLLSIAVNITLACAQTVPDATVVSIKGTAFVRNGKNGKQRRLKKGDELFSDFEQEVRCAKNCQELKISYCNVPRPIINSSEWTPILSINCSTLDDPRGGATKGEGATILSPRESEVVQPETFVIKWESNKPVTKVKLTLKVHLGKELWSKGIDVSRSVFESDELKRNLKAAQRAGNLNLILISDEGHGKEPDTVIFRLISLEHQQTLNKRLEAFEAERDEVLKHLGRGMTFSEYEIYGEGVVELERAFEVLQSEGASQRTLNGLIRLVIMANYQAHNDARVKQLCSSLNSPAAAPAVCAQIN